MLQALGIATFVVVMGGLLALIARRARAEGVLLPVAVGFGVRAAAVGVTHVTSLVNGDGGFFYFDDRGYANAGRLLADQWASLHPGELLFPVGILPHGGPLFYHLLAGVFLLTADSVLAMKAVDVVMGTATVLFAGMLAERVLGPGRARSAAWVVALAPTIVWWTVPMLREPLATMLATAALLVATRIPAWRAVIVTAVLLAALAFTRSTLFAAVALGVVVWIAVGALRVRGPALAARLGALAAILLVSGGLGFYMATGSTGNVSRVGAVGGGSIADSRELDTQARQTPKRVAGGQETRKPAPEPAKRQTPGPAGNQEREGPKTEAEPKERQTPKPAGDPGQEDVDADKFDSPLASDIAKGNVGTFASAAIRFFVAPRAWAFTTVPLDWYQPVYPGMWLWYMVVPVALMGLWRLRRRLDALLLVVPVACTAAIYTLALNSGVRQRSGVEPLLALLVIAGWRSLDVFLLGGGAVLIVLAPLVAIDLGEPLAGLGVALAGALVLAAGWSRYTRSRGQRNSAADAPARESTEGEPARGPRETVRAQGSS